MIHFANLVNSVRIHSKTISLQHRKTMLGLALEIINTSSISTIERIMKKDLLLGGVIIEAAHDEDQVQLEHDSIVLKKSTISYYTTKFIYNVLPGALCKQDLSIIEHLLVSGQIPNTVENPAWNVCVAIMSDKIDSMITKSCQNCGTDKAKLQCKRCKEAYFCSSGCKYADLKNLLTGHYIFCNNEGHEIS